MMSEQIPLHCIDKAVRKHCHGWGEQTKFELFCYVAQVQDHLITEVANRTKRSVSAVVNGAMHGKAALNATEDLKAVTALARKFAADV
jgi:DNA primase